MVYVVFKASGVSGIDYNVMLDVWRERAESHWHDFLHLPLTIGQPMTSDLTTKGNWK